MEKQIKYELVNGLHMGITSIDELVNHVKNDELRKHMIELKEEYQDNYRRLIQHYPDAREEIKNNVMIDAMLKMKALMVDDQKIAKMLIEGCNQGVMTSAQLLNKHEIIENELKECIHDFDDISKRYAESLKIFL